LYAAVLLAIRIKVINLGRNGISLKIFLIKTDMKKYRTG